MKAKTVNPSLPVILLAILALLAALWGGLVRIGWQLPALQPEIVLAHGALMVSGFLGTLISLERAFALKRRWMFAGPVLSGMAGLAFILGLPLWIGQGLIILGGLVLVGIFIIIMRMHLAFYTVMMALGALTWLGGNLLWLSGWDVYRLVLWWAGFLILTIAGERLELGRILHLSRLVMGLFIAATGIFLAGLILLLFSFNPGSRVAGVGLLAMAIWLLRYDIARRTVRQAGLPRFAAVCLLSGYVWLGTGGIFLILFGGVIAGFRYDAVIHAIFLGFVMSMIFGHAPIIFPSLLGFQIHFRPSLYLQPIFLHLSLIARIAGDLSANSTLRRWGGLFNEIAILIFLGMTIYQVFQSYKGSLNTKREMAT
ncbi:MAG: hypothetical protein ACM3PY_08175 [Omnitrophica WOR_2 bacterium]